MSHKYSKLSLSRHIVPVDNNTTFLAHYDITANDVLRGIEPIGGAVATLRPIEGYFGGGIAIEQNTENLIGTQGGGASQDWSKWSHYSSTFYWGGGTEQYEDPDMGIVFKGTPTGNSTYLYNYYPYTLTSGGLYTNSIYLRADYDLPDQSFNSYLNSSVGGQHNVASSVSFTGITSEWKRFEATHTVTEAVNGTGGIGWGLGTIPSGCAIYACMPQLEGRGFATSYTESVRGAGNLRYDKQHINPTEGTISFWFNTLSKKPESWSRLFQLGGWTADMSKDNLEIRWGSGWNGANSIDFEYSQKGTGTRYTHGTGVIDITPYTWYFIAVTWKSGGRFSMTLVNSSTGEKVYKEGTATNAFPTFVGESTFMIGTGGGSMNGMIDELRIDKIERTKEEIESWYVSQLPFYPKGIYRLAY